MVIYFERQHKSTIYVDGDGSLGMSEVTLDTSDNCEEGRWTMENKLG